MAKNKRKLPLLKTLLATSAIALGLNGTANAQDLEIPEPQQKITLKKEYNEEEHKRVQEEHSKKYNLEETSSKKNEKAKTKEEPFSVDTDLEFKWRFGRKTNHLIETYSHSDLSGLTAEQRYETRSTLYRLKYGGFENFGHLTTHLNDLGLNQLQKLQATLYIGELLNMRTYDSSDKGYRDLSPNNVLQRLQDALTGKPRKTGKCGTIMGFQAALLDAWGFDNACTFTMRTHDGGGHINAAGKMNGNFLITDYGNVHFSNTDNIYELIEIILAENNITELNSRIYDSHKNFRAIYVTDDGRKAYRFAGLEHELSDIIQRLDGAGHVANWAVSARTGNTENSIMVEIPLKKIDERLNFYMQIKFGAINGTGYSTLDTSPAGGTAIVVDADRKQDFFYRAKLALHYFNLVYKNQSEPLPFIIFEGMAGTNIHLSQADKIRMILGMYFSGDLTGMSSSDDAMNDLTAGYFGIRYSHNLSKDYKIGIRALGETRVLHKNQSCDGIRPYFTGVQIEPYLEYCNETYNLEISPIYTYKVSLDKPGIRVSMGHAPSRSLFTASYQHGFTRAKGLIPETEELRLNASTAVFDDWKIKIHGEHRREDKSDDSALGLEIKKKF